MNGIDWSKSPADAQGFMPYDGMWISGWWKDDGGSRYFWSMEDGDLGEWKKSYANPFERPGFIKRPSAAWNGEGLPPVGTVCEWKEKTGFQWVKAKVLFITDSSVVMQRSDGFEWQMMTTRTVFRPFRTPEQIAADERESAVNGMLCYDALGGSRRGLAEALYDAGYRKQAAK